MTTFGHDAGIWADFPDLRAAVLVVDLAAPSADPGPLIESFTHRALARLADGPESELPEIRAWRRAFAAMGLRPTQYRCASESLLRRLRREGSLPRVHPVVDLCNAVSAAYAVPVAALDRDRIVGNLVVRRASGAEVYQAFSGDLEHPAPGEVVFADDAGVAHARRWTNRQSGLSAVRPDTRRVLVVAEGLHEDAAADLARLAADLDAAVVDLWDASVVARAIGPDQRRVVLGD